VSSCLRSAHTANQYSGKAGATPIVKAKRKSPNAMPISVSSDWDVLVAGVNRPIRTPKLTQSKNQARAT
jgi:hypothetical protein